MGLKGLEGFRELCLALSADTPSPGGGAASAAAGAMGSSLLAMVCGLALRKQDIKSKDELLDILHKLERLRDRLIELSEEDAESFEAVMASTRARRAHDDPMTRKDFQEAVKHAADVPMTTAQSCLEALEASGKIAGLALKSTSTDLAVGVLLCDAGLRGAVMNVRVNLKDIDDGEYVKASKEQLDVQVRRGDSALNSVLLKVEQRYGK